ncbi:PorT family protein [Mucilaginibacter sp. RS28]|uniref:PorT family protein n=1 Tax=Mucilaginibacter straminoryzae TaxID=2932774 RepID=A0A9X1X2I6_9SPHI|nr:outer membrane beta-barrel protein [Mucilaginibacter straminoryzae]MCJ8209436.1 PorT family protein [Mucilaginibacter straminoryzae]
MKRILFTALVCAAASGAFAQSKADSTKTTSDSTQKKGFKISFGHNEDRKEFSINRHRDTTIHQHSKAPGFSFGLTFARFDIGLATLVDNGSFTLSPNNQFLRYRSWKTSNVGFDVFQFGYRFTSGFKIYLSGGFDWTHIRLRDNITILPNEPVLTYRQDNIDYEKNRFSSSYLRIPLSFDFRSKEDSRGKRFHFVAGPDIGLLLNGRVKQISEENGKQKFNDDYHFTKLRYGAFARIGYGGAGLFAKYYFNDMFENSPAQKGLKNFSFGFMFGF